MPTFAYKVKAGDGKITNGLIEADAPRSAIDRLRSQKLVVLEIAEKTAGILDGARNFFKGKVSSKELTLFSRQLSTLVAAGVPIVQSLGILEAQAEGKVFREVLGAIRTDIESGLSISDALKKHPEAFPELYTSMVRAGEVGGILDVILERLSAYLESSEALRGKVKSAMTYPIVVLSICAAVTIFLLIFVIPTFKAIFASFHSALPAPTQALLDLSDFLRGHWWIVIVIPIAGWHGFKRFYKTPYGHKWVDGRLLKLPMFGILLQKFAIARFSRTLGTLVKSGVPILQALETVSQTAGNIVISESILAARQTIREGGHLSEPLKKSGIFPTMVTSMISVGEETGSLDQMLQKIADFYDNEVDTAVKGLTSMIEPIVIVLMGIIIGSIVIAMFLPMFDMGQLVGKVQ